MPPKTTPTPGSRDTRPRPQPTFRYPGEQILTEAELRTIASSDVALIAPLSLARQAAPRHP